MVIRSISLIDNIVYSIAKATVTLLVLLILTSLPLATIVKRRLLHMKLVWIMKIALHKFYSINLGRSSQQRKDGAWGEQTWVLGRAHGTTKSRL